MRNEFSKTTKRAAWERCEHNGGHYCEQCDVEFTIHSKPEYDHIVSDWMDGGNDLDNCKVLCTICHGNKTAKKDIPAIAKSKRIRDKLANITKPKSRPMDGTKASGVRKRMNGTVEHW